MAKKEPAKSDMKPGKASKKSAVGAKPMKGKPGKGC